MTEFEFKTCRIRVDVERTRAWHGAHGEIAGGCACVYCRNFAASIERVPEEVKTFFNSLGLDLRKPCEVMELGPETDGKRSYEAFYHLAGRVEGNSAFRIELAEDIWAVFFQNCDLLPEEFPRPCFQLNMNVTLPWLLDEPSPTDL